MIYIATTTINTTKALKNLLKIKLKLIALDKNLKILSLKTQLFINCHQHNKWNKLSRMIGWNCIQRRNFAILEAYERGAQIIALIDDDNIPYNNWFKKIFVNKNIYVMK